MNFIDISWPISQNMTAYKDKSVVRVLPIKEFQRDAVRESLITLGSHTGTHIDAPAHFIANGVTIEAMPLCSTIGPCVVIDMMDCTQSITSTDLIAFGHQIQQGARILFKTRNSLQATTDQFNTEFVYIDKDAAAYLAEQNIQAVGIDYLGIERNQKEHETHTTLMKAGVVIIEGLRLGHVTPGDYFLYCLPLALIGTDGAPARAILVK